MDFYDFINPGKEFIKLLKLFKNEKNSYYYYNYIIHFKNIEIIIKINIYYIILYIYFIIIVIYSIF